MFLQIASACSSPALAAFLSIAKRIILLIQIIVPILLLIWGSLGFISMMNNPDQKNGLKNILNKFLAAAIVFFIPVLVNAVMGLVGESTDFSSCWNSASDRTGTGSTYVDPGNGNRSTFIPNSSDYEKGQNK